VPDYQALIFDFDGTLADSLDSIADAMAEAFVEAGLPAPARERVARSVGVPLLRIVELLLPPDLRSAERVASLIARYRVLQQPHLRRTLRVFDGYRELMDALAGAGRRVAVLSNKGRADLLANIRQLGIGADFERVVGGDDHPEPLRKPHPHPLLSLLEQMQVPLRHALMVGDTVFDLRTAVAARVDCAAVTFGYHSAETLAAEGPTYSVDRLLDLLAIPGVLPPPS